jgi:hypothetical protein
MTRTKLTLAATAALAATLSAPAAAAAAPSKGDWEASGAHGALGSFELSGAGHRLAVRDLVVQAPISCRNAPVSPLPTDVEIVPGTIPLAAHGAFSSGTIKKTGSGTTVRATFSHGRFAITYRHIARTRNPYEGGQSVCDTRTIHLTAKRGHRRALKQGIWAGTTVEQEPVELSVVAGGRALSSPVGPGPGGGKEFAFGLAAANGNDPCSYDIDVPMFIPADGGFSNAGTRRGDEAVLSGQFSRATKITGQFENLAEGCGQESWSADWSFSPTKSS